MPFPAATITMSLSHGPPILGAGCPKVLIGGKPAWRVTDQHTCPVPSTNPAATPHGTGVTIPPGAITVMIGGPIAARQTDKIVEAAAIPPAPNVIVMGVPNVLIK